MFHNCIQRYLVISQGAAYTEAVLAGVQLGGGGVSNGCPWWLTLVPHVGKNKNTKSCVSLVSTKSLLLSYTFEKNLGK